MKNVIVLFEVTPTKAGMQKYLDLAAMLKPMLSGFEGFIRAERFSSLNEEGKLLCHESGQTRLPWSAGVMLCSTA